MRQVTVRDMDVPLSPLGERQAAALGGWFGALPPNQRPNVVLTSPYVRARATADILLGAACVPLESITHVTDERLREREFGIFDRLTKEGVREKFPEQAEMREAIGKFYHRPPGGESWCDVILRLRSVIGTITRDFRRERVLIVTHSVVVLCFRYLFEHLTEAEVLAIDREHDVANCSATAYGFDPHLGRHGRLALRLFNFVAPLEEAGAQVTRSHDVPVAPK